MAKSEYTTIDGQGTIIRKVYSLGIGIENDLDKVVAELRASGKDEDEVLRILREQYAYPERYEHAPNPKPDSIKITVYELNKIMSINDQRLERIAFAVLCLWKAHGCVPFTCTQLLLRNLSNTMPQFTVKEKNAKCDDLTELGYYGITNYPSIEMFYRDIKGFVGMRPAAVGNAFAAARQVDENDSDVQAASMMRYQELFNRGFRYRPKDKNGNEIKGEIKIHDYFKVLIDDPNPRALTAIKVTQADGDHLWELYDAWRATHHKCSNCGKKYAGVNMCPDCAKLGRKRENSVKVCACGRLYVVKNDADYKAKQCWVCWDSARHAN